MHITEFADFYYSDPIDHIKSEIGEIIERSGDGYGTNPEEIEFDTNLELDSYDNAHKYLEQKAKESHNTNGYEGFAVRYHEVSKRIGTKKSEVYNAKAEKLLMDLDDFEKKIQEKIHKNAFITCKKCKSKLNTNFLSANEKRCPCCNNTLLTESENNKLEKLRAKIVDLREKEKNAMKAVGKEHYWLVMYVYHG